MRGEGAGRWGQLIISSPHRPASRVRFSLKCSAPNGQHGPRPAPPRGQRRRLPARRLPGRQHDGGAQGEGWNRAVHAGGRAGRVDCWPLNSLAFRRPARPPSPASSINHPTQQLRTMEIIDGLEGGPRGVYSGACPSAATAWHALRLLTCCRSAMQTHTNHQPTAGKLTPSLLLPPPPCRLAGLHFLQRHV